MVTITRLNDKEMIINCDLIESMEATPDTTITLTTGRKVIAKESIEDVIDQIVTYKRKLYQSHQ